MQKLENAFMLEDGEAVKLIKDAFGVDLGSIGATEELGPYSHYVRWVNKEVLENLEDIKAEYEELNFMYCTNLFLHLLCAEGLIEPGTYIIDCTW